MRSSRLPTVHLGKSAGLLARWLRIAGFPVRTEADASPPLSSGDGTPWRRVRLEGDDIPSGRESMAIPEAPWPEQLAELARSLKLDFSDLCFHRFCATCGGELGFVERRSLTSGLPPRIPTGIRHLLVCSGCARVSWPGAVATSRVRQLRQLFLEHMFRCGRCGETAAEGADRHLARIEIQTSAGPVVLSVEDIEGDPSLEIAALLRQIEGSSEQELVDSVAFVREKPLCTPCKRALLRFLTDFFREEAG